MRRVKVGEARAALSANHAMSVSASLELESCMGASPSTGSSLISGGGDWAPLWNTKAEANGDRKREIRLGLLVRVGDEASPATELAYAQKPNAKTVPGLTSPLAGETRPVRLLRMVAGLG
jgi:hypothetical protein